ncbi:hypothetical protein Tco_1192504 [Tanacetum coccineum]
MDPTHYAEDTHDALHNGLLIRSLPPDYITWPLRSIPLPAAASPTAYSPGYVPEFDSEKEPKEDDKDPEEDPTDYPTDREDDDDDDKDEDEDYEEDRRKSTQLLATLPPDNHMTAQISHTGMEPIHILHPGQSREASCLKPPPTYHHHFSTIISINHRYHQPPLT